MAKTHNPLMKNQNQVTFGKSIKIKFIAKRKERERRQRGKRLHTLKMRSLLSETRANPPL